MKLVWKCEYKYCSGYHEDKKEAIKHEEMCSCNPINQRCISCKHHDYHTGDGDERGWYCEIDEDAIDTGVSCNKWRTDE